VCAGASFQPFFRADLGAVCTRSCQSCIYCWGFGLGAHLKVAIPGWTGELAPFSLAPTIPDDDIRDINFSGTTGCVIRASGGTLWCWTAGPSTGGTPDVPLAQVPGVSGVKQISSQTGGEERRILLEDKTLLHWPETGPIGPLMYYDGTAREYRPIAAVEEIAFHFARMSDGTVWDTGGAYQQSPGVYVSGAFDRPLKDVSGNPITQVVSLTEVSAGTSEVLAVKQDGTVWQYLTDFAIGVKRFFQVPGVSGATAARGESFGHYCYIKTDKTVWCSGDNRYGQLGNGTTSDSSTPVQVSGLSDAVAIAVTSQTSCAKTGDGSVLCWGNNRGDFPSASTPAQLGDPCFRDARSTTPHRTAVPTPAACAGP